MTKAWENGSHGFEDIPQGVPHLTKIIHKPCGVGVEYKDTADVSTRILLHLQIQEGAELMERKRFCDMYPKHVATTLQLTVFLHWKGHVVYGDSYLASLQTTKVLLERGTYMYFTGIVKTASKGFLKTFLNDPGWLSTALRGDTLPVKHTYTWNSTQKEVYGHAWNELGTAGAPKKCLISSWNHTLGVDDHVKLRWSLNDRTGEGETITRTVPRTQMIKCYFEGICCIDAHNHLHQGSQRMEDSLGKQMTPGGLGVFAWFLDL